MKGLALGVLAVLALLTPGSAAAQFSDPCGGSCIAVLGATGFVTATGVSVAVGRATGGMTGVNQGLLVWGGSFAATVGVGMALSGNGAQQERTVYSAGIGTVAGALVGLAVQTLRTDGDEPRVLAGTLIGAALGAVAGGVYGAVSYDGDESETSVPVLSVSIPF